MQEQESILPSWAEKALNLILLISIGYLVASACWWFYAGHALPRTGWSLFSVIGVVFIAILAALYKSKR